MKKKRQKKKCMVIITGPTGVGKTALSLKIAPLLNGEIINADMGQMYAPLSIGTAKPAWQSMSTPHHFFDIFQTPSHYTVVEYRKAIAHSIESMWQQNKIPLVVGGSGFYIKSLFFPPIEPVAKHSIQGPMQHDHKKTAELWHMVNAIDPDRAKKINQNDRYRLERALAIWAQTGMKPSTLVPHFKPLAATVLVQITRNRAELHERIEKRIYEMMAEGWITEVRSLIGAEWELFIQNKKIIGYNEITDFIKINNESTEAYQKMIALIIQRTKRYAKQQETFWRGLVRMIENQQEKNLRPLIVECNLSTSTDAEAIASIIAACKEIESNE